MAAVKADPELLAMHRIVKILDGLPPGAQNRIMWYLADRYDPPPADKPNPGNGFCVDPSTNGQVKH